MRSSGGGDGGADLFQVGQAALEERLVGQHADAGGAVVGVGAGDGDGIEVGADHAGRRRGALDLGDELDGAGDVEGGAEVAHRRGGVDRRRASSAVGDAGAGRVDLAALAGDDAVEDGGHVRNGRQTPSGPSVSLGAKRGFYTPASGSRPRNSPGRRAAARRPASSMTRSTFHVPSDRCRCSGS